jgi:hypothetical protein
MYVSVAEYSGAKEGITGFPALNLLKPITIPFPTVTIVEVVSGAMAQLMLVG